LWNSQMYLDVSRRDDLPKLINKTSLSVLFADDTSILLAQPN
jgi:hypothetical protein